MLMNVLQAAITTASLNKMQVSIHMKVDFNNFIFKILPVHNILMTLLKFSFRRLQKMKKEQNIKRKSWRKNKR